MKSRLFALLSLVAILALSLPALAKRTTVAAKMPATLRAEAKDDAASVGTVKKGENLTVLGASGDWSNVQTTAGKKGWVKTTVVSDKKASLDSMNTDTTTIAAAENTTASAIRGKGVKRKTAVVGTSALPAATLKAVTDELKGIPQVTVVDSHVEKTALTGEAAAKKAGAAKKADLVVFVSALANGALSYEFADLKSGSILAKGETKGADAKDAAREVQEALSQALVPPAAATTSSSGAMAHPNAPLTPATDDCVKKCVDRNQMKASTLDSIKADCEKECAQPAK